MPHERVKVAVSPDAVDLIVGTQSSGQGHETSFRQVMADQLGVEPGRDQLRQRRQRHAWRRAAARIPIARCGLPAR